MRSNDTQAPLVERERDGGFTLIEVLLVMIILGIVMAVLALAFSVAVRSNPDTADRLDDARTTRGLATWLSHDTSSTPPFVGDQAQGGMVTTEVNTCGGPGTNLLHLKWVESAPAPVTWVANYRFVAQPDGTGEIVRVTCSRPGTAAYGPPSVVNLTSNLDASAAPTVNLALDGAGSVTEVSFQLTGATGESVLVETASRNPADFFP